MTPTVSHPIAMPQPRAITALRSNSNDLTVPPRTPLSGPPGRNPSPRRSSTRSSLWQRRNEMSGRLAAGQVSFRRLSNAAKKPNSGGGSGRTNIFSSTFRAKFGSQDQNSEDGGSAPLITKLDKYSAEELKEYRLVFNVFDADRSGAIGLDEMENAIINLGMDPKQVDLQALIKEADRRNNNQIDFDEFCEVMKTMSEKTKSWNEVIRDCFTVFDRNETGVITRKDFEFILRELGHIDNSTLMDELFQEFDVDSDGVIDFDEFGFLVKAYLTDDDIL